MSAHHLSSQRKPVVTMSLAGDIRVIDNILKKKKLLDQKNLFHEEIRPLLILPAGAMRGSIEAGIAIGLEKHNLIDAFDTVVGISAGAAVAYYMLAKESAAGGRIIFDDMVREHFINFLRITNVIDVNGFEKIMREIKPIRKEILLSSRSDFYVGVTNVITGEGSFVDVKKNHDPLSAVISSLCIPILSGREEIINGHLCFDGGVAMPLPVYESIEAFKPTDILVAMSSSMEETWMYPKFADPLLRVLFKMYYTQGVQNDMFYKHDDYKKQISCIKEGKGPGGVRICAIYPETSKINLYTIDHTLLEHSILDAKAFTEHIFAHS